jgi:hypothetical protein
MSHSWVTPTSADSGERAHDLRGAGQKETIAWLPSLLQLLVELADELRQGGDLGSVSCSFHAIIAVPATPLLIVSAPL